MNDKKKLVIMRIVAMLLIITLTLPVGAQAAIAGTVQPYASNYLTAYTGSVSAVGGGKIQVWYTVTGVNTLDLIGVSTIQIYESTNNSSWKLVRVFNYKVNTEMVSYNDNYHSGHVDYQGVAGRYYRARICVWGGGLTVGDSFDFYTSSKRAT